MTPSLAIVTPSLNQGAFLEAALGSVLNQHYPRLEYVVVDGGSTDQSPAIIRRYAPQLAHAIIEPDRGQYDALNKGFARTSGEIMAWLNSDDLYTPWAFAVVAAIFQQHPQLEWLTTSYPLVLDDQGQVVRCSFSGGFHQAAFDGGRRPWIQQESTFWRRSLWERAGGRVDASLRLAGDCELWSRFFRHAELYAVATPLAAFRRHAAQKTSQSMPDYLAEVRGILGRPVNRWHPYWRQIVGGRPLDWLPRPLAGALVAARLLRPVKLCRWHDGAWQITQDYIP